MFNKLIITALLVLACTVGAAAQQSATYRDAAAWDAATNSATWTIQGYDVLLSQTNVTAAQLGTTNGIPNLAGVLGNTRVAATNTVAAFRTFLASNPVPLPYTLWARTVANQVGYTNIVVSDWTNITVNWLSLPPMPANLRVQQFGP